MIPRGGLFAGRFGVRRAASLVVASVALAPSAPNPARADFGGASFWLPGGMGSLAATPGQPGWAWTTLYLHLDTKTGGGKVFQQGGSFVIGVRGRSDIVAFGPSYVFQTPVLGGQAAVSLIGVGARGSVNIDATLTGPGGGQISGHRGESLTDFADLFWQASLKWNQGVHNYMVYGLGNFPIAEFDPARLVNFGLGHWSIDGGAGYTYFNPQTGYEFSIVGGLTYNFINPYIDYQNGIDSHIDWGASKFLNPHVHIGVVGYFFQQLTGDSDAGATLGPYKGRVFGIGPQIGFLFPAWEGYQGYFNVKAYWDFAPVNRPTNTSVWVALAFSPAAPTPPPPRTPMHVKAR